MKRLLKSWWIVFLCSFPLVILIPSMGSIVDLKITKAFHDIRTLSFVLEEVRSKTGGLPDLALGLQSLVGVDLGKSGQLSELPTDPWGNPYLYAVIEGSIGYMVYSSGFDGRDDKGLGDDVTTRDKKYSCDTYGLNCPPTATELIAWLALGLSLLSLLAGMTLGILKVWKRWNDQVVA